MLLVGAAGTGKTQALRTIAERAGAPLVNVGVELSRRLLELASHRRPLRIRQCLEGLVAAAPRGDVVLLDNTELLFDVSLQQDPLRLLRDLSRHRTIVAAWTGVFADGTLRYGEPGHPEYQSYTVDDVLIVPASTGVEP